MQSPAVLPNTPSIIHQASVDTIRNDLIGLRCQVETLLGNSATSSATLVLLDNVGDSIFDIINQIELLLEKLVIQQHQSKLDNLYEQQVAQLSIQSAYDKLALKKLELETEQKLFLKQVEIDQLKLQQQKMQLAESPTSPTATIQPVESTSQQILQLVSQLLPQFQAKPSEVINNKDHSFIKSCILNSTNPDHYEDRQKRLLKLKETLTNNRRSGHCGKRIYAAIKFDEYMFINCCRFQLSTTISELIDKHLYLSNKVKKVIESSKTLYLSSPNIFSGNWIPITGPNAAINIKQVTLADVFKFGSNSTSYTQNCQCGNHHRLTDRNTNKKRYSLQFKCE